MKIDFSHIPTEPTSEPLQSAYYVYDGDNRAASPERSAGDNLVKSIINGKSTYYLGKLYQKKIDGTEETILKYYSSGSAQIAVRTIQGESDTLQWLLSDHLGSTSTTANADGTWNSTISYTAFGEIRTSSGITPTEFRYTGQLRQAELGLYYYVARWYDPYLNHFVQADTLVPNAGDSAAYDRYAYVRNNPIKYNDPSGHFCIDYDQSGRLVRVSCGPGGNIPPTVAPSTLPTVLATHTQQKQSSLNNCGPHAASLGSVNRLKAVQQEAVKIERKKQNNPNLSENDLFGNEGHGIQPSTLAEATSNVYALEGIQVTTQNNATWRDIFNNLLLGNRVIVDILATEYNEYVSEEVYIHKGKPAIGEGIQSTFAHFAQVIGMDIAKDVIYLDDSISYSGHEGYWIVSSGDFAKITNNPEINASLGPDTNREATNYWILIIHTGR